MKDPRSLIRWMYRGGGADRQHWDPKIFIVLLDLDRVGEHAWEMKRSLDEIEKLVNQYLENTRETDFYRGFTVTRRKTKYPVEAADLMFLVKDAGRYEGIFYVWKDNKPLPRSVDL